jgi:hypothetical protein
MAQNRPNPRKGVKFLDTKVLIAALSLAVTLGFWNLFSNQTIQNIKKSSAENQDAAQQPQTVEQSSFPPLPTISALVDVKTETIQQVTAQNAQQPAAGSAPLRAVTAPEQKIVQKGAPVVDMGQPVVVVDSGGGNQPAGAAPAPVTTTKSSK